jgi:hypothetical protein
MLPKTAALATAIALLAAPSAGAASPRNGAAYMGKTTQGETIALDVSANGKRVVGLETALTYTCTGEHDGQSGSFTLDSIKIKRGTFRAEQTLRGTSDESVVQGGVGTAKGTFKRKGSRVSGSLRSTLTLSGGETCDSGRVAFKALIL